MDIPKTELLFLNRDVVLELIDYSLVVNAVEQAFLSDGMGEMMVPNKDIMEMGNGNSLFAMPGALKNLDTAGVKWTNFYPNNPEQLPTIWGHILILSHIYNGQPYAILDATPITNMRTAGGHGVVSAKYLAKKNSKTLSVLGCGAQGRSAVESFDANFSLDNIYIYDIFPESAEKLQDELSCRCNAAIKIVSTIEELVADTDILVTCTTSSKALITMDMLPKGCFVSAMYSFNDVDPAISSGADKWVLGHKESDRIEILEHEIFGAQLTPSEVYSTLGEIIAGKKQGRSNDDEIIIFTHMGMGSLDVAIGEHLVKKAIEKKLGVHLRLT